MGQVLARMPELRGRVLITLDEAATYMACTRRTLENEVTRGRLQRVMVGRCVRVSVADLEAYIQRYRQAG
jgi:excisionase family DNA binding protein